MTLVERLDMLCSIQPGTVWTEYHWREALQIKQEVAEVQQKLDMLTFRDETGHSTKMSVADWIAYWRARAKGGLT